MYISIRVPFYVCAYNIYVCVCVCVHVCVCVCIRLYVSVHFRK